MDCMRRSADPAHASFALACALVHGTGLTAPLLSHLAKEYLSHPDVRYYLHLAMARVATGLGLGDAADSGTRDPGGNASDAGGAEAREAALLNAFDVLCAAPPDFRDVGDDGETEPEPMPRNGNGGGVDGVGTTLAPFCAPRPPESPEPEPGVDAVPALPLGRKRRRATGAIRAPWALGARRRRAFSAAWLALLRVPSPPPSLRRAVLGRLATSVVPHLCSPLLLCDFLTDALDGEPGAENGGGNGGENGEPEPELAFVERLLALEALFLLVTRHGLEHPALYARLYGLLRPPALRARCRGRFLGLLDGCLASGLVSAATAAAFAKRLGRLALAAPPAAAAGCLAVLHNVLRRHPATSVLLHRRPAQSVAESVTESLARDPYDAATGDAEASAALASSLWEVPSLARHYCPDVARLAAAIGSRDLTNRRRTAELDVGSESGGLAGGSYASLLSAELRRRLKAAPLAFHASPPATLLGGDVLPGWAF